MDHAHYAINVTGGELPDAELAAYLDEARYREKLWKHKPLTDFWRVGRGTVERLSNMGICT